MSAVDIYIYLHILHAVCINYIYKSLLVLRTNVQTSSTTTASLEKFCTLFGDVCPKEKNQIRMYGPPSPLVLQEREYVSPSPLAWRPSQRLVQPGVDTLNATRRVRLLASMRLAVHMPRPPYVSRLRTTTIPASSRRVFIARLDTQMFITSVTAIRGALRESASYLALLRPEELPQSSATSCYHRASELFSWPVHGTVLSLGESRVVPTGESRPVSTSEFDGHAVTGVTAGETARTGRVRCLSILRAALPEKVVQKSNLWLPRITGIHRFLFASWSFAKKKKYTRMYIYVNFCESFDTFITSRIRPRRARCASHMAR